MPEPSFRVVQLMVPEPSVVRAWPELPAELGKVSVQVPAAALVVISTVPEVVPLRESLPVDEEAAPRVKLPEPKVKALESVNWPPVVAYGTWPLVRPVTVKPAKLAVSPDL